MTYGIEVRVDTNNMRTLRTIVERTRRDRVRNTDIIEQCGTQDIVKWERQRKRRWFNHVRQMDENRLPKIALENPPGSRPPWRPPKRWKGSWHFASLEKTQKQLQN